MAPDTGGVIRNGDGTPYHNRGVSELDNYDLSLAKYAQSIGLAADNEALYQAALNRERGDWPRALSAAALYTYFSQGDNCPLPTYGGDFNPGQPADPPTPPADPPTPPTDPPADTPNPPIEPPRDPVGFSPGSFVDTPAEYTIGSGLDLPITVNQEYDSIIFQTWSTTTQSIEGVKVWANDYYPAESLNEVSEGGASVQALVRLNGETVERITFTTNFVATVVPPIEPDPVPSCGDGFVQSPETCDDGNTANGDGCNMLCALEPGFVCVYRDYSTIPLKVFEDLGGNDVDTLIESPKFPDNPDQVIDLTSLEMSVGLEDYGSQVEALLIPPLTGQYTFYVSGDDNTNLYLSLDDTREEMTMIANVPGWTSKREWDKFDSQKSISITLEEGKQYYLQVLHKEGILGDHFAVAWQWPGSETKKVIASQYLRPYVAPFCGDGIVNGQEQCDGGPGCTNCIEDIVTPPLPPPISGDPTGPVDPPTWPIDPPEDPQPQVLTNFVTQPNPVVSDVTLMPGTDFPIGGRAVFQVFDVSSASIVGVHVDESAPFGYPLSKIAEGSGEIFVQAIIQDANDNFVFRVEFPSTVTSSGDPGLPVPDPPLPVVTDCSDAIDNDGDGLVDLADPGCTSPVDQSEVNDVVVAPNPSDGQCNDGIDNDGDGLVDWQYDLGCYGPDDNTEGGKNNQLDNGWTVFEPHSDTKVYYISSSDGSDSNNGLSPQTPFRSANRIQSIINAEYGKPIWFLFKRGDTWFESPVQTKPSGRSADAPMIFAAYGDSIDRPEFKVTGGIISSSKGGINNVAFIGQYWHMYKRNPYSPDYDIILGLIIRVKMP